ncbi:MAG: hypothetical protein ACKOEE_14015 [Tagaea sp.]
MTLKHIRLELARTKQTPDGDPACGYEFAAPLAADGHLDPDAWRKEKDRCTVRRFWRGAADERGLLVHGKGGRWAFSYAPGEDDDEPIFKFDRHRFVPGEYVSITELDGETRPFKVVSVR